MNYIYKIITTGILSLLFLCLGEITAQEGKSVDEDMRYGQLSNGFTYLIKNIQTEKDVQMKLFSKAGLYAENQTEYDVGHGIEHLAFEATKNFPLNIREDKRMYQQFFDAKYGNLVTYSFRPGKAGNSKDLGLTWFRDIADGLLLKDDDIEQVIGEIRQEKIMRMGEDYFSPDYKQILYSRLFACYEAPPDLPEHYKNLKFQTFKDFYKKWYRPDLLGLVIIGDIDDIENMENLIKDKFSSLESDSTENITDCSKAYLDKDKQIVIIEKEKKDKKESDKILFNVIFKTEELLERKDFTREYSKMELLDIVLTRRFKMFSQQYNSFFIGNFNVERYGLPPGIIVDAQIDPTLFNDQIQQVLRMLTQFEEHGISQKEMDFAKNIYLNNLESKKAKSSSYFTELFKRSFLYNISISELNQSNEQKYIEELSLKSFNSYIEKVLNEEYRDYAFIVPSNHKLSNFDQPALKQFINRSIPSKTNEYTYPNTPSKLISEEKIARLKEKKVIEFKNDDHGRTFQLENGVKIILLPTQSSNVKDRDVIKIHGYVERGLECFPSEEKYESLYAPSIVKHSGVGGMNKFQIERFMDNNNMQPMDLAQYIDQGESGVMGTAAMPNLEKLLELMYLSFSSPNFDNDAFVDWKKSKSKGDNDVYFIDFQNEINKIKGDDLESPMMILGYKFFNQGTPHFNAINELIYEKSYTNYKQIFGNAYGLKFLVTGDFESSKILPLLNKYLGNLPASGEAGLDCGILSKSRSLDDGPKIHQIKPLGDYVLPITEYAIEYIQYADNPKDWKEQYRLKALGKIAGNMAYRLRFEEDLKLYSISVGADYIPHLNTYEIYGFLSPEDDELEAVRNAIAAVFKDIKNGNFSDETFTGSMQSLKNFYSEKGRLGHHFMIHQNFYYHHRYGRAFIEAKEVEEFLKSITREDIINTAKKYINEEYKHEFVMKD